MTSHCRKSATTEGIGQISNELCLKKDADRLTSHRERASFTYVHPLGTTVLP